jgi:hypothetical protein
MVGRTGFEPVKAMPADLQSAPFDRFGTYPFESQGRKIKATFCHLTRRKCRFPQNGLKIVEKEHDLQTQTRRTMYKMFEASDRQVPWS